MRVPPMPDRDNLLTPHPSLTPPPGPDRPQQQLPPSGCFRRAGRMLPPLLGRRSTRPPPPPPPRGVRGAPGPAKKPSGGARGSSALRPALRSSAMAWNSAATPRPCRALVANTCAPAGAALFRV